MYFLKKITLLRKLINKIKIKLYNKVIKLI